MSAGIRPSGQENYYGKIILGNYSERLKKRLSVCMSAFFAFDSTGAPNIAYISAWKENDKVIWYEYVGRHLMEILGCQPREVAAEFRRRIIDRREYKYLELKDEVREEIIPKRELDSHRAGLRQEGKKKGSVEAIYKLSLPGNDCLWLKDKAVIEYFEEDDICISIGCLTDVTKEMDHKELLEKIGYFDELTKLPKRKILERILDINIGQVERSHLNDFSFLMIDIDHFKKVNDTFGHQTGDCVLESMAELMNTIKRKEDELGRYGGEEFYAVSHGAIESGRRFAERLRKRVEMTPIACNGNSVAITISIGVASASELPILRPELLLELADKRLYAAKQLGRNRVVWRDE